MYECGAFLQLRSYNLDRLDYNHEIEITFGIYLLDSLMTVLLISSYHYFIFSVFFTSLYLEFPHFKQMQTLTLTCAHVL